MRAKPSHRAHARRAIALTLSAALALAPACAHAARHDTQHEEDGTILGMSRLEFAIATAVVITGLRVVAVYFVGGSLLGRSVGTGLMALYLGHVVAEGAIYGVAVGTGSYALSGSASKTASAMPPRILPQRLTPPPNLPPRLPLELGGAAARG